MNASYIVLLALRDASYKSALETALEARGHEVILTSDPEEAVQLARGERPDALILDAALAGGASRVLMKLRNHVFTAHLPVLVLAASAQEKRVFARAGATACLDPSPDVAQIEAALARHALEDLDFTLAPAEVVAAPARLAALADAKIMDSPVEASFDRLTQLAQSLVGAPMALFSLVGEDQQFFKSQVGLAKQFADDRRTDLKHSFCQWVVTSRDTMVVEDAGVVVALKNNLALRYMRVHAYAGIPIMSSGGEAIGSFCALDSTPRKWTSEELATISDLAAIAEAYLHRAPSATVARRAVESAKAIGRRFGGRLQDAERKALKAIITEQQDFLGG